MLKSTPITMANGNFPTTGTTFTLSVVAPSNNMMKNETVEACLIFAVTGFAGSSTPSIQFNVDEFVDGNWIPVGQTSAFTGTGFAVIDSSGGASSTGGSTFTGASNLRALGKGKDTRVRTTIGGTVGTAIFTIDYIGYFGS